VIPVLATPLIATSPPGGWPTCASEGPAVDIDWFGVNVGGGAWFWSGGIESRYDA